MNPRSRQQVNAEAEAARNRAPITDRVNAEPAILNGMTVTEAQVIGAASLVVFLVLGGLIFVVIGQWQVLLMLAIFGPALVLWFSSLYLAKIKRGRPDGFYTQAIQIWREERGLIVGEPKFLRYGGWWGLGRTLDLSLTSPLNPPPEQPEKPAPVQESQA